MKSIIELKILQIGAFHAGTGRTPTNADALKVRLEGLNIHSICASYKLGGFRRAIDMAATLFRKRRRYSTVLIHVFSGNAYLWVLMSTLIAKKLGKRVVYWLHGGNLPSYSRRHPSLVKLGFGNADRIFAPSGYLKAAFADEYAVEILPYELEVKSYPYRKRTEISLRLLWLRAFNAGYNPLMAVRVVHRLAQRYPSVHLMMCGPDNGDGSFQATRRLAEKLGVSERIEMPGKVSKERIRELGQECDIFINTTNVDNTPVSVIEAMAMGMCVVSTNVGGIPYLISNERDALLVLPDDDEGMAEACSLLVSDEEFASRLSENARMASKKFEWGALAPVWESVLRETPE